MKMERPVNQNLHILSYFTYSQTLKMVTRFFLSVSVFSIFFSHSSFLPFFHSLKHFIFSIFPYQLFTHTLDKNFMFLICNGLLVFLANYSGLIRSLSLSSQQDESHSKNFIASSQSELPMPPKKLELIVVPESIGLVENVAKEEGNEDYYYLTNQRETEKEVVEDKEQEEKDQEQEQEETALEHVAEHKDENKYWLKDDFLSEQEKEEEDEDEDEDEEVGNGEMSTEELNKKFDEFIRRMKEELRIEAQRQLIMV